MLSIRPEVSQPITENTAMHRATSIPIRLAFATDANYLHRTGVALHSILKHASRPVEATILYSGLSDADKEHLLGACRPFAAKIHFAEIDIQKLRDLPVFSRSMSYAAYFRLLLPELVPPDLDKILYLDSDIVCCGDIAPLWETDVSAHAVASVREPILVDERRRGLIQRMIHSREDVHALGEACYLNSGVMLINVNRWRSAGITERVLEWRRRNSHLTMLYDQDALNAVICGDWLQLSVRWNFCPSFLRMTNYRFARQRRRLDPVLVHLSAGIGPARYRKLAQDHLDAIRWPGCPASYGSNVAGRLKYYARIKWALRMAHIAVFPFLYGPATEFGRRTPARLLLQGDDGPAAG